VHSADSKAGKLGIGLTEKNEICRVAFMRGRKPAKIIAEWRREWPQTEFLQSQKTAKNIKALLHNPVLLVGTAFQGAVWRALAKIPYGRTQTYGEIARRVSKAKASQAVGQACGANPVPYFIPCHRVVSVKGLGGFSAGLAIKKKLLSAEKVL